MVNDQIKDLAKQAGGTTYAVFDPYQPEVGTWMLSPAELAEFVRLVRGSALKDAASACDGEKWCDTGKKSIDYIRAFNEGCDDCVSIIGRMR